MDKADGMEVIAGPVVMGKDSVQHPHQVSEHDPAQSRSKGTSQFRLQAYGLSEHINGLERIIVLKIVEFVLAIAIGTLVAMRLIFSVEAVLGGERPAILTDRCTEAGPHQNPDREPYGFEPEDIRPIFLR
ncbi:MAG: hypothetical protein LBT40_14605 [Deltaproteobacteria bacterium]|nr:hypothetical protein [Deltaproteobacteria bacterium]